jgi:2-C-methyl-D-erythritol 4-phosphate cytidylyltransferase
VETKYIPPLLEAIKSFGAAALGIPASNTIKECTPNYLVKKTFDRTHLWEMQTPQGVQRELLIQAFDHVKKNKLEVTDDLSMVEAMGINAKVVPSSPRNFKITTPFDFDVARLLCDTN